MPLLLAPDHLLLVFLVLSLSHAPLPYAALLPPSPAVAPANVNNIQHLVLEQKQDDLSSPLTVISKAQNITYM